MNKKMNKKILFNRSIYSICIVFILSFFPFAIKFEETNLLMGFPVEFYTIYLNHKSMHFNLGHFIVNSIAVYLLLSAVAFIANKIKHYKESNLKKNQNEKNIQRSLQE